MSYPVDSRKGMGTAGRAVDSRADKRAASTQGSRSALSERMVDFAERWFPDSFAFVLGAVVVVAVGAMLHGSSPTEVSVAFGDGFSFRRKALARTAAAYPADAGGLWIDQQTEPRG